MKDMRNASCVLGVEILRDRNKGTLGLSQRNYLKFVLKRFSMENCKPALVPMAVGIKLSEGMCPSTLEENKRMEKTPCASALGSLMYAMLFTRPDLCYTVGVLSRYQMNPGIGHWNQIKHDLHYVQATLDYSLCFNQKDLQL